MESMHSVYIIILVKGSSAENIITLLCYTEIYSLASFKLQQ